MNMSLTPTWTDIAIRLALTMLAGVVIGFNRGARGHAAGFRTTILVALAASVAMILANILLPLGGKTADSFSVMDPMRLPLGILTGVGFIGGGTIVKKGDLVVGVTTAATLWLVTVIGLCFGGGQLILGAAATVLAVFTLWILRWVDRIIPREHRARLIVTCDPSPNVPEDLSTLLRAMRCHARFQRRSVNETSEKADYMFELYWRKREDRESSFELLVSIDKQFKVKSFELITDSGR
jgi:putative Mg2+ transporter-C (MgtC) family protein